MSLPHPSILQASSRGRRDSFLHTADRRRSPRAKSRKLTAIYLPHDGAENERVAACITDLSATGLGMAVARALVPGQRFHVEVREGGAITPLLYAVVRCDPIKSGCFRVGAVLLEVAAPTAKCAATTEIQRVVARLRRAARC